MTPLIESLGKTLGVAGAMLTVSSVGYDYSFLAALGLDFSSVPTTLADHARTAVLWAPLVVAFFVLLVLPVQAATVPLLQAAVESLDAGSARRSRPVVKLVSMLAVAGLLVAMGVAAMKASTIEFVPFAALVLALLIPTLVLRARRLLLEFEPRHLLLAAFGLVMACVSAYVGYQEAYLMASSASPRFTVELKTAGGSERLRVLGLRRFGSVAVVVRGSRDVLVVPDAALLSVAAQGASHPTVACRIVASLCR